MPPNETIPQMSLDAIGVTAAIVIGIFGVVKWYISHRTTIKHFNIQNTPITATKSQMKILRDIKDAGGRLFIIEAGNDTIVKIGKTDDNSVELLAAVKELISDGFIRHESKSLYSLTTKGIAECNKQT